MTVRNDFFGDVISKYLMGVTNREEPETKVRVWPNPVILVQTHVFVLGNPFNR